MDRLEEELTCAICCAIFSDPRRPPQSQGGFGQLLGPLPDPSRSEGLRQHKARCQSALRSHREAALRCFKDLGDALEQKKAAVLSALDGVESCISEKYDPLMEEVEKLKVEEDELKELHAALLKEESPLLFLEKLQGLQLRLQALGQKQLPEPEALEMDPSMEQVLQEVSRTELGQLPKLRAPKLQLAPKQQQPRSGLFSPNPACSCSS
ncbi:tripartite motif-containing protein 59 [Turdus rufiventris]|nr:tripartite motif-containing protein 59 [Turdus rufiventris]